MADMANPEQLAILQKGTDAWNEWRKAEKLPIEVDLTDTDLTELDLDASNLSVANLRNANLCGANLREADLGGANLLHANLRDANLGGADLCNANLTDANFSHANLSYSKLCGTDLWATNLSRAKLFHAMLTGARLAYTLFADVDLSLTAGLDSAIHIGPSTIGTDTIVKSKGAIPEIFLRGAGLPDAFIKYAKSLVASATEFYACFISYSTKDQDFAERLYADLQQKGVRCWFAPHDIQGGRKIHEQIDEAIRLNDRLLLILSPHSMASEWVQSEISKARKREVRDNVRVLFPISLVPFQAIRDWESFDADTGKDSAREIREYFIPDFSNWKNHDSYQKAFERLVNDLKTPSERTSKTS